LEQVRDWPLTTKAELVGTEPEGFAMNRTFPIERYVRLHRTSGTRGRPLVVLDTHDDWCWWLDGWQFVLDAAGISAGDRIVMAFSFGPFIGFWSAYDACVARGALVAPTGGMTTLARLDLLLSLGASCVFCTPSYALRLAEVASENGIPLATSPVRCLVVAGEPGGSVPATRRRIEAAWGARVVDHSGATEVGPWGYADRERLGLHVNESEFLAECLCVGSDQPAADGQLAELVLTTLGRSGSPVLRYRTGDLVRPTRPAAGPNRFLLLSGGVLGRVDEMLIIRGVNVFPSAVEAILREFPEIGEFRITAYRRRELEELRIEIEDLANDPGRVVRALDIRLGLRVEVSCVAPGSLPRFEGKGRRFVDRRDAAVAAADGT
jgi:phenylacetate-CoA ligase